MSINGPEPSTDREYLIRIYDIVAEMHAQLFDQKGRIEQLEAWHQQVTGGAKLIAKVFGIAVGIVGLATALVKLAEAMGVI